MQRKYQKLQIKIYSIVIIYILILFPTTPFIAQGQTITQTQWDIQSDFDTGTNSNTTNTTTPGDITLSQSGVSSDYTETTKSQFDLGNTTSSTIINEPGDIEIAPMTANEYHTLYNYGAPCELYCVNEVTVDNTSNLIYISTHDGYDAIGGAVVINTQGTTDTADDVFIVKYSITSTPAIADNHVYHIALDDTNHLVYISTGAGLSVINTQGTPYDASDDTLLITYTDTSTPALPNATFWNNLIKGAVIDTANHLIYVGTWSGGLAVINTYNTVDPTDDTIQVYTSASTGGVIKDEIRTVTLDTDNNLVYVSSPYGGVSVIDTKGTIDILDDTWTIQYTNTSTPPITANEIVDIIPDATNHLLYIQGNGWLSVINTQGTITPSDDTLVTNYNSTDTPTFVPGDGTLYPNPDPSNNLLYINTNVGLSVINTQGTPYDISDDTVTIRYTSGNSDMVSNDSRFSVFDAASNQIFVVTQGRVFSISAPNLAYNSSGSYISATKNIADIPTETLSFDTTQTIDHSVALSYRTGTNGGNTDLSESIIPNAFQGDGIAQGWHGDDSSWSYTLPFDFTFYGITYVAGQSIKIGSNGYICLNSGASCTWSNGFNDTTDGPFVAPFLSDLRTQLNTGDDIYITTGANFVRFRWQATEYGHNANIINFETTIFANGEIQFNYGNQASTLSSTPTIGISKGDGTVFTSSTYNGNTNINQLGSSLWTGISFSAWSTPCATSPCPINQSSLIGQSLIQYKIDLTTSTIATTPIVHDVTYSSETGGYITTGTYTSQNIAFPINNTLISFTSIDTISPSTAISYDYSVDNGITWSSMSYNYTFPIQSSATQFKWRANFSTTDSLSAPAIHNITLTTDTPPTISGINAIDTMSFSATIQWNTDEPSNSTINYSTTPGIFSNTINNTNLRDIASGLGQHAILLSDLTPNTTYYYQVASTDENGNISTDTNSGSGYTFTTTSLSTENITPTITSISSDKSNGIYTTDDVIDIDITFSEAVTSIGDITVTFETGDIDRNCTFTITNSTVGTCNYTVQSGDTSLDLNTVSVSGLINNQSGFAMTNFTPDTTLAANKDIVINTTTSTLSAPSVPKESHSIKNSLSKVTIDTEKLKTGDDVNIAKNSTPKLTGSDTDIKQGSVILYQLREEGGKEKVATDRVNIDGQWNIIMPTIEGIQRYFLKFIDNDGIESDISESFLVSYDQSKTITTPATVITTAASAPETLVKSTKTGFHEKNTDSKESSQTIEHKKNPVSIKSFTDNIKETLQQTQLALAVPAVGIVTGTMVAGGFLSSLPIFSGIPTPLQGGFKAALFPTGVLLGLRKKRKFWGMAFDTQTKQALSNVRVSLINNIGRTVDTTITDKFGRYGFLTIPGAYTLSVNKGSYKLLTRHEKDVLYGALYQGGVVTLKTIHDIIEYNLALDPGNFNWSEFAQRFAKSSIPLAHVITRDLFYIVYAVGFIYTLAVAYFFPDGLNMMLAILYVILFVWFIIQHFIVGKSYGTLKDKNSRMPIAFAQIALYSLEDNRRIAFAVTDPLGRYYLLAEDGKYIVKVGGQFENRLFSKENTIQIRNGSLRENFVV